jgi:hypothetical protein
MSKLERVFTVVHHFTLNSPLSFFQYLAEMMGEMKKAHRVTDFEHAARIEASRLT